MGLAAISAVPGLLLIMLSFLSSSMPGEAADIDDGRQVYIVYLGGKGERHAQELVQRHSEILATVTTNSEDEPPQVVYNYKHGFDGFSARMTARQAEAIARLPDVVTVFRSKTLKLHTTRSWNFLETFASQSSAANFKIGAGADVIVGLLDTGIWPESASFSDTNLPSPPSRWKGLCNNTGVNSTEAVTCNNKIIGARGYDSGSARDDEGHGSHTASTAAGSEVSNASMSGVASGTARGGLPAARIAAYKVCGTFGCGESVILKAFDDAIYDGVDILSLSLGGLAENYDEDAIAIGAFHAIEHNITVVCSAGNSGPDESSVSNSAPWIVTVGASTIDRCIASDIVLGNGQTLQGTALNFHAQKKPPYSLVLGSSVAANTSVKAEASTCDPDSLSAKLVKNNILVCMFDPNVASRRQIVSWLSKNKATGAILINDFYADIASYFPMPTTIVKKSEGSKILAYMNSTTSPVATLLPTKAQTSTPAPVAAGFSSRGPNPISEDIIKPDVTAPGVNILAAWSDRSPAYYEDYDENKPVYVKYNIISGTSMSCPHVSGALALLKSAHPNWSPAALKSAIMTTATTQDDEKEAIRDYDGSLSNPFAFGSGQIDPLRSLNPGLVYDTTPSDYVAYLCATGYSESKIRAITGNNNTTCSKTSADLNYPSIAFPSLSGTQSVTRHLTSVASSSSTYQALVKAPSTLSISISPSTLTFATGATHSYTITVSTSASSAKGSWHFASITWSDGVHSVYSPIAVKPKA